ncbi:hypothetical protein C8J57DRAFT_1528960 [Mycena rebaudengoi]|nr:hypothetical protein C8J57DRAFT_1528960 [Mycena rebaudengoi]
MLSPCDAPSPEHPRAHGDRPKRMLPSCGGMQASIAYSVDPDLHLSHSLLARGLARHANETYALTDRCRLPAMHPKRSGAMTASTAYSIDPDVCRHPPARLDAGRTPRRGCGAASEACPPTRIQFKQWPETTHPHRHRKERLRNHAAGGPDDFGPGTSTPQVVRSMKKDTDRKLHIRLLMTPKPDASFNIPSWRGQRVTAAWGPNPGHVYFTHRPPYFRAVCLKSGVNLMIESMLLYGNPSAELGVRFFSVALCDGSPSHAHGPNFRKPASQYPIYQPPAYRVWTGAVERPCASLSYLGGGLASQ